MAGTEPNEPEPKSNPPGVDPAPSVFEERYGEGSRAQLIALLEQPCVTFAAIAVQFGVSRERVRQWHRQLLPDAPTGHVRQRLCALHQQRRRLFGHALFRSFFQHARLHFETKAIQPIQSRHGYRTNFVRLRERTVALRGAASPVERLGPPRFRYRGSADFVYVALGREAFLFVPASVAPAESLEPFTNSFDAFNHY